MDGHHQHYTLKDTPKHRNKVSCGSPEDMGLVSQKPSMPEGNRGNTQRSNKYTGGQVADAGPQGQHRPLIPRCKQPWAGWMPGRRLTPCRQSGAEKQRPRHVSRSQVPSKLRKRGAGFEGGRPVGDLCPAPAFPEARRSALARPRPSAEGGRRRPAGGKSIGRAVPCRVRERCTPWGSPATQAAPGDAGAGAAPRVPRSGTATARPAQRDPEGRRKDREEGRGRARGEAGRRSRWNLTRRLDRPLLGRGEEIPTDFPARVVPYKSPSYYPAGSG